MAFHVARPTAPAGTGVVVKPPLFALPERDQVGGVAGLTLAFVAVFMTCYGGASALSAYVPWRVHVDFPFEQCIPFVPAASWAYLSMNLLVGLTPFALRRTRELWPLFSVLCAQTVFAALCFMLVPVETRFGVREVVGAHAGGFALADLMNLERNFLPSLHVSFAVTASMAIGSRTSALGKLLFGGWAAAIAVSTMLIHEHHVVDVLAGGVLAWTTWHHLGTWAARESTWRSLQVDWLCARACRAFGLRHPRYLLIAVGLARASLPRWRGRRVLRTGFCFLQIVDDLLDGDRPCTVEPLELVDELVESIEHRRFRQDDLGRLAEAFTHDLLEAGGEAALRDAIKLIRIMQRDRRRVLSASLLGAEALRDHHRETFHYSVDLMLVAGQSEVRARDVPELIEAFGWCSTVRDLEEDLEHGLVNVPADVVQAARGEGVALLESRAVHAWLARELGRARELLDRTDERLAGLEGKAGTKVLRMFARSIRRYAEHRVVRRYPALASMPPVAPEA